MNNDFTQVMNNVINNAQNAIKINEGDYEVDGLFYCHLCDTPKQKRLDLFGSERIVHCLCKCAAEKRDAEENEIKQREFMLRIDKMRHKALPEEKMRNWTFANDDRANEKVSSIAMKYVANFDKMRENGKGLLLFGSTGTGKTFTATCIANALIDKGYPCYVTNFARIGNTLQGMYEGKQDYLDSLNRVQLLVLDDLGIERTTPYMQEIVYNVVDARCRAGLPLIVTTNLTSEELKKASDISCQRIYSRLFECCIPIEVAGQDRRRKKLKEEYNEYNDLLGL